MVSTSSTSSDRPEWAAHIRRMEDHIRRYRATDGEDGHLFDGQFPSLLLTTTGRRSGKPSTTPLIYGRDGDRYLVVASMGGAPRHPAWYLNLVAKPEVEVQVLSDRFNARARTATAGEKPGLWDTMTKIFPPYLEYQTRTTRDIPVVILERLP